MNNNLLCCKNIKEEIQRDIYFDILKGILIILVVIGHILQLGSDRLSVTMVNFIYSFHMPLFILVSGYFSNFKSKSYIKSIFRLLEIFLVFQLIHSVLNGSINFHTLLTPRFALWYLLSLVYWKIMLLILPNKVRLNVLIFITSSIILCLASGLVNISTELSFQRTFAFMPFFVVGYLLRSYDYRQLLHRINYIISITACIFAFVMLFFINTNFLTCFSGTTFLINNWGGYIMSRILILLCGSVISISIMRISLVIKKSRLLSNIGQASLHIYIYHTFFYLYLFKPLTEHGFLPNSFPYLIIYSLFIILVLYFTSKVKLLNIIMNPFTNLLNI